MSRVKRKEPCEELTGLSPLNPQPSTLNPHSSTLIPQPSNLNPEPSPAIGRGAAHPAYGSEEASRYNLTGPPNTLPPSTRFRWVSEPFSAVNLGLHISTAAAKEFIRARGESRLWARRGFLAQANSSRSLYCEGKRIAPGQELMFGQISVLNRKPRLVLVEVLIQYPFGKTWDFPNEERLTPHLTNYSVS